MWLASKGKTPPKQWIHKADMQNVNGMTVAMYLAWKCMKIPNQEWNHDPNI